MTPRAKLRPVGQPGAHVPPVPPLAHDRSNRAFIAEATVRRSLRTARATPTPTDQARHRTPRGEKS